MKKTVRVALLLLAPLALMGVVLYGRAGVLHEGHSLLHQTTHQHQVVPQARNWVPFSADIKRVYEKSGEVTVGRVYRSSDGSTRSETGPSLNTVNTIAVKNIATRTFYLWQGNEWWTAHPMELPPDGWHPFPRILSPMMAAMPNTIQGFSAIKTTTNSKSGARTIYEAADLNFLPLITTVPCDTTAVSECGIWHSNVRIAEQRPELFRPPAGAQIVRKTEPGGIIKENAPATK